MHKRTIDFSGSRLGHVLRATSEVSQRPLGVASWDPTVPETPPPLGTANLKEPPMLNREAINKLFPKEMTETERMARDKLFREGKYAASYTTFAGCDMRFCLVPHLETRDLQEYRKAYGIGRGHTLGSVQAISMVSKRTKERRAERIISGGTLVAILFDKSLLPRLEEGGDLVLMAANEYGDLSMMVLPDFKIVEHRWAISIDDLVSEEEFDYEAGRPIPWDWVAMPRAPKKPEAEVI